MCVRYFALVLVFVWATEEGIWGMGLCDALMETQRYVAIFTFNCYTTPLCTDLGGSFERASLGMERLLAS